MRVILTILSLLLVLQSQSLPVELNVDRSADNSVIFISQAPLESFEGKTSNIDGYVTWQGENPADGSEFYFEVDLASLDTGIGLRNRHMRDNYLETEKYPYAVFQGSVSAVTESTADSTILTAKGKMTIHGVEKEMEIPVTGRIVGDTYTATASFDIDLNDHKIKIPKLMFMKISNIIRINLLFHLKRVE